MRNWISRHLNTLVPLGLVILSALIYFRWLNFNIFAANDYQILQNPTLKNNSLWHLWVSDLGFGSVDAVLWRPIFTVLPGLIHTFTGLGFNVIDKFIILWPWIIVSVLAPYLLVSKITKSIWGGVAGSLVFAMNTYFLAINTQGHLPLSIASAFGVLSIYFFIEALDRNSIKIGLITSLSLSITSAYDTRFLYITLLILLAYTIAFYVRPRHIVSKLNMANLALAGLIFTVTILLNIYWLFSLHQTGTLGDVAKRGLFGDRFWSLKDAVTLHHPFWNQGLPTWFLVSHIPLYYWIIPLLALGGLYVGRKNKTILFFGAISVCGVLLTKQSDQPFPHMYSWLTMHFPGFGVFREATKFYYIIALGYAVLIGELIAEFVRKKHKSIPYGGILGLLVVAAIFIPNSISMISGSIGTMFIPRTEPSSYMAFNKFINNQSDDFRTLWIPTSSRWGVYTNSHPQLDVIDALQSSWAPITANVNNMNGQTPEQSVIDFFNSSSTAKLISSANIKYLVVPLDQKGADTGLFDAYGGNRTRYISILNNLNYLSKVPIGDGSLAVFLNKGYEPPYSLKPLSDLVQMKELNNVDAATRFLTESNHTANPIFTKSTNIDDPAKLKILFTSPTANSSNNVLHLSDAINSDSQLSTFFYDTVNPEIVIKKLPNLVSVYHRYQNNLSIGSINISADYTIPDKFIGSYPVKRNQQYVLLVDNTSKPLSDYTETVAGSQREIKNISVNKLVSDSINGFNDLQWQDTVGDCHDYDQSPIISMQVTNQLHHFDKSLLMLSATRHSACNYVNVPLTDSSSNQYQLSFDYQGNESSSGGVSVNYSTDNTKSISSFLTGAKNTQSFSQTISAPIDARNLKLTFYANEVDGTTNHKITYSNIHLRSISKGSNIRIPTVEPIYTHLSGAIISTGSTATLISKGYDGRNLIDNPSFENGLWASKVEDCNSYDTNSDLKMSLDNTKFTDGTKSILLSAHRHTACTSKTVPLAASTGRLIVNFDVESNNQNGAGYNISFDDESRTAIDGKINLTSTNSWQHISNYIKIPSGAKTARLTIYSFSADDSSWTDTNYDNFYLASTPDIANTIYQYSASSSKLQYFKPSKFTYKSIDSTKQQFDINSAKSKFILTTSQTFHNGWKLYIVPYSRSARCPPEDMILVNRNPSLGNATDTGGVKCSKMNRLDSDTPPHNMSIFEDKHIELNGYANGWVINPEVIEKQVGSAYFHKNSDDSIDFRLTMYFEPESKLYVGLKVSASVLIITTLVLLPWNRFRSNARSAHVHYKTQNRKNSVPNKSRV